jgi:multidrug efflux pump subunit AcrB
VISRFFIDRPIFAAVLSIVITLAGGVCLFTLPLAQFPSISPPTVQVTANYPGASAKDVAEAVAAPIEQQVNGVDGMMYMSSQCNNDGSYNLTVTFQNGIDLNMAQVLVQTRVSLAIPLLPDVIKQTGVTTLKRSPDILMGFSLNSPPLPGETESRYDQLYLSNYALMQVRDELLRVPGVSDVFLFGQRDYSMRIWVDPEKLAARNLTAGDVVRAIREQNDQLATGQIGQPPVRKGQDIQITLSTRGRLVDVDEFANIILKTTPSGQILRIKDIGKVELGGKNEDISVKFDGKDTIFLAVFQLPDANALSTKERVVAKMDELQKSFPRGVHYEIAFDTTPYTSESIKEVFKTLLNAILLVAAVVLLFLQNWRSTLIPLAAVPVGIVGTFSAMAAFGFSLNNLTLFGLVLAIGIVVDDAIVVVEAVEHHIDNGMRPREATIKAMEQVSGPVIAVGLVLSAVFVPCAFITGITGMFFRQFALTIAVSTMISTFNSLTLSPALTALLLRSHDKETSPPLPRVAFALIGGWLGWEFLAEGLKHALELLPLSGAADLAGALPWVAVVLGAGAGWLLSRPLNSLLRWFFGVFNASFVLATHGYTRAVRLMLEGAVSLPRLALAVLGAWLGYELIVVQGVERALALLDGSAAALELLPAGSAEIVGDTLIGRWGTQTLFPEWLAQGGWALLGAVTGWVVGGLITYPLRWVFTRFLPGQLQGRIGRRGLFRLALPGVVVALLGYGALLGLTLQGNNETPSGFIPSQDMGYLMVNVQLPDSTSQERTLKVMSQLSRIARNDPGVKHATAITGQSFVLNATGSNFGSMFINLDDYDKRRQPHLFSDAIANRLRAEFAKIPDAETGVFGPPPVRGVGRAGGFAIMIEDRGDAGPAKLQKEVDNLTRKGNNLDHQIPWLVQPDGSPQLVGLRSVFRANVPQLHIDPDPRQCMQRGVTLQDFADTLSVYEGSLYVNDFNLFGRTWQVNVQADSEFRNRIENLNLLQVRNKRGGMVPLGSLAEVAEVNGPLVLTRYNMYPAAAIYGTAGEGVSSGDAIALMQRLADEELPSNMAYEWTDMSYLELQAGSTAMIIFGCAVVMVFLVLAAQYESWSLPLAVILVVPLCLLSAIAGVAIAKMDINIFTRIGFVVLVGLASKNAILIVEFAKVQRHAGMSRVQATLEACKLRLRPIIMTSLAFVLGVLPLLLATGAGAEMRRTLGNAVFSGMIGVTVFGIFLTPVFFFTIDWLGETHLFRTAFMRRLNAASVAVLGTVGHPWRYVCRLWQDWAARRPAAPAGKNGQPGAAGTRDGAKLPLEPHAELDDGAKEDQVHPEYADGAVGSQAPPDGSFYVKKTPAPGLESRLQPAEAGTPAQSQAPVADPGSSGPPAPSTPEK